MPRRPATTDLEKLAQRFTAFARLETHGVTPLYERLSIGIANDPQILEIAAFTPEGQPPANMIFAAVHYLLLEGRSHPLAEFYPSLTDNPIPGDAYPAFREFCLQHRDAIIKLITTRLTQTNEAGRSALLLPAFEIVSRRAGNRPLALVEIGPGAGLNQNWSRYDYVYETESGHRTPAGAGTAALELTCALKGSLVPPLPEKLPVIESIIGIDLNPLDVQNPDDERWLRALIWPEHRERARRLQQAIKIARHHPPQILKGKALDLLPEVLGALPGSAAPVVYHTFALYQFSPDDRARFNALLAEAGGHRDLYRVSIEWYGKDAPVIELDSFEGSEHRHELLAHCNPHGRWLEWVHAA